VCFAKVFSTERLVVSRISSGQGRQKEPADHAYAVFIAPGGARQSQDERIIVQFTSLFDRFLPPDRRLNPEALAWVAVILAAITMLAVESSIAVQLYGASVAGAFLVTLVHAGALPLAMLRAGLGGVLSVLACGVLPLLGTYSSGAPWPWMVPVMITQILVIFVIGLRTDWRAALAILIASIAVSAGAAMLGHRQHPESDPDSSIVNIVVFSCIAGGVFVAAVIVRQWQLISSQLLQERENTATELSKRIVVEEKTRIARELHDIIAHSMSIINIQASSAPYRHPEISSEVQKEFADISGSARQALAEMRRLLDVLRSDQEGQQLAPQPKLPEIENLVQQAQQVGVRVTLLWSGDALDDSLQDSTSLAGYRIVQEALSNAVRHARNSQVRIRVHNGGTTIRITVVNTPGRGPAEPVEHGLRRHHGLVGLRERAVSVGGEARAGRTDDGGFEVEAVLPLGSAANRSTRGTERPADEGEDL
jgi:signal transduction histidine kinase